MLAASCELPTLPDASRFPLPGQLNTLTLASAALVLFATPLVAQRSVYIEDLTWPEVQQAIQSGKTNAIIYAGSTELTQFGGWGHARIGVARSTDLVHWQVP